jgi:hypothetical protein
MTVIPRVQQPVRHRRESEVEQNLRIELNNLRSDVYGGCALLEARLNDLAPAAHHLSPRAHQTVTGSLRIVHALQRRVSQ